ncbi:MAG: SCO family protein [Candidatus Sumerlaeaceae bacterium]
MDAKITSWPSIVAHFLLMLLASLSAGAQGDSAPVWREVGIDQKIGHAVPTDLVFLDETGRQVRLKEFFTSAPVIITPVYFECPMLCTQVLNGLVRALKVTPLRVGKDFQVVTFSFDPKDTPQLAAEKKKNYIAELKQDGAELGWHFLTGNQETITSLTQALGFRYVWDKKLQQYAHAAAIIVVAPDGTISRYFYGIDYPPRDLRLGVIEASNGKIGNLVDQAILLCYKYDPLTGRYGWAIITSVRVAGIVTVIAIISAITLFLRKEFRARKLLGTHTVE